MNPTLPATGLPAQPRPRQPWQPGHNGYALTIAVLVHLLLLAAVLSWRSKAPPPPKPRSSEISIVEVKPPPKTPEPPPPPAPKLTDPPPPNIPLIPELPPIELPRVEPVPQDAAPLAAPPAVAPAAAPVPAPVVAAAAPPAASAVGSKKLFEDCADAPDRMMVVDVYRLSTRATSFKEMDRRSKPVRTVCLTNLNIAPRHLGLGIPGLDISEWFGLDIRFTLNVPEDGSWDFVLLTDDGSALYVDGVQVIVNDGIHAAEAVMGTVPNLTKGPHNIRVRYFQETGDAALMLGWKKSSDAKFVDIPRRLLGRPAATVAAAPALQ